MLQELLEAAEAATVSASRKSLFELLEDGSDVDLVFAAADKSTEKVPAHSSMLKQWSSVLAGALDINAHSSSGSISGSSKINIPLYDTHKEDWLLAMEFIYPVNPQPQPTWELMKTLMLIGDKYSMPALLQRVGVIVTHNMRDLDLDPDSELFVWDWIHRLEQHGLTDVSTACVSSYKGRKLHELMSICPMERLHKLSSSVLVPLVTAMKGRLVYHGAYYCRTCALITRVLVGASDRCCLKCNGKNIVEL